MFGKVGKCVFSLISLTEGLRLRPPWRKQHTFFFLHCQKHLAMAPWGATDGRATVPLDPVEDGKFGQQPFFHSKTEPPNSRTTSRRPNILLSYGSTIRVSHATAYEISPVHASNYLQKDCTQTTGCIVCDEKWPDVLCCITVLEGMDRWITNFDQLKRQETQQDQRFMN